MPDTLGLPQEIWDMILEFVGPKSKDLASPEDRYSLSEESFAPGLPLPPAEQSPGRADLLNFRKSCPQFAELSRRHLYARLEIRFTSLEAVEKLRRFADAAGMAPHVKQLSYMMPRLFAYPQGLEAGDFFEIRVVARKESTVLQDQVNRLLNNSQNSSSSHVTDRQRTPLAQLQKRLLASQIMEGHIDTIIQKAVDQRNIIKKKLDAQCLLHALERFTSLQQIRLMPLAEKADIAFERYLDTHQDIGAELRPSLSNAFRHGAKTLSSAVIESGSKVYRFSSRSLDLGPHVTVTNQLRQTMCDLAERLVTMDLQFVYKDSNIDDQLPNLFSIVLQAAVKLRSLHVGFGRRVSMPLECVFHDIHFRHLQHLGIHEWRLHAGELIRLLYRHKDSLKSLRLRHVSLKEEAQREEGLWRTVLRFIRLNLRLTWISLRGVCYSDDTLALGGMQFGNMIYGHPPAGDSDSSDDVDDDIDDTWSQSNNSDVPDAEDEMELTAQADSLADTGDGSAETQPLPPDEEQDDEQDDNQTDSDNSDTTTIATHAHDDQGDSADDSNEDHEDSMSDLDDAHNLIVVEDANTLTTVRPTSTDVPCYCDSGYAFDNLRDNGNYVTKQQWKRWELWVKRRCQRGHDPPPTAAT